MNRAAIPVEEPTSRIPDVGAPRPFYGWRMVWISGVVQAAGVGLGFYFFAQIVTAIQADFGTNRVGVMYGPTLGSLVGSAASPFVGTLVDRGWIRPIVIAGALLMGLGWIAVSLTSQLWQFVLCYGVVLALSHVLCGILAATTLVSNWFVTGRGRALGLAALGTSLAGFAAGPLVQLLLTEITWRETCFWGGIAAFILIIPPALLIVRRPEEVGQSPDGAAPVDRGPRRSPVPIGPNVRQILRERNFWSLTFVLGLIFSVHPLFGNNIVAYANDLGITGQMAGAITSAFAIAGLAGKLLFSLILDRIGRREGLWLTIAVQALGWSLLCQGSPSYARFLACAVIFGLGTGGMLPAMGALIGACFGRSSFGRAMGLMSPIRLPLVMVSPLVGGFISDQTGSYALAFQIYMAAFVAAALLLATVHLPEVEPGQPSA